MGSVGAAKRIGGGGGSVDESMDEATRYIDQVEYDRDRKYQEWEDTAAWSHSYDHEGRDGSEQVEFFKEHSNYDELISSMTAKERDAFHAWTRGEFMDGAQYRGWDGMSSYEQEYTRIYDKILDQATLDRDIVVTRRTTAELVMGAGKKNSNIGRITSNAWKYCYV